jgi:hypothetical protein
MQGTGTTGIHITGTVHISAQSSIKMGNIQTTLRETVGKGLEREREGEFNRERSCAGCCETEK